jgi:hypothetical protein
VGNIWKLVREVLTPGRPEFRAHLARADEEERRLLRCLQILDDPATREINASTNEAAEF